MEKFKIGDVIKMNEKANDAYIFTTTSKVKEAVVKGYFHGEVSIKITKGCADLIGDSYIVNDECIDLVRKSKSETIVIYRNNQKVVALGKTTGEKAEAKCNPADEFDFHVGAKLAFNRLMGDDVKPDDGVREVKRKAKVGEYVKVVNAKPAIPSYKNGDIFKVTYVTASGCICKNSDGYTGLWHEEYVVLENYKPEKEPEKKDEICVGDTVKVTDSGKQYRTYGKWSGLNGYKQNFVYGSSVSTEDNYKVLAIKKHDDCYTKTLALIQNPKTSQVFIINVKGLKKVER